MENQIQANLVLDSISPSGKRISTFETQMPMHAWVHLLTHRMFSRNLQSSRAIPVKKLIKRANYLPGFMGINKPGMSSDFEAIGLRRMFAVWIWKMARILAIGMAGLMRHLNIHKEVTNRLLTPFILVRGLVTMTEIDNFFKLRLDKHAQYDIRMVAEQMQQALLTSVPKTRALHMPLLAEGDLNEANRQALDGVLLEKEMQSLMCISAARCARVSYLNHEGFQDKVKDLDLARRLWKNGHMSPFEHVAQSCAEVTERSGNFYGWKQLRHMDQEILQTEHTPLSIATEMSFDDLRKRVGRIAISHELLSADYARIRDFVMSQVVVIKAEYLMESSHLEYVCYSHLFDVKPEGAMAPYYTL